NGDSDKSFSGDGAQFIDTATFELGVKSIVQSDGKILTLIQLEDAVDAVERLNSDGSPDATFGVPDRDRGVTGLCTFLLGGTVGSDGNQVRDIALDHAGNVIVS